MSKHQVPCGICSSLSKWVLGVSLALTHIEPMFSFGMPWKQKDIKVLSLFQRLPKGGTLPQYGLYLIFSESFDKLVLSDTLFQYLFISFNVSCAQCLDCLSSTKNDVRLALESFCFSRLDLLWHSAYFFHNHWPHWFSYMESVTTRTYSELPHIPHHWNVMNNLWPFIYMQNPSTYQNLHKWTL